jgi:hypothetical protein
MHCKSVKRKTQESEFRADLQVPISGLLSAIRKQFRDALIAAFGCRI